MSHPSFSPLRHPPPFLLLLLTLLLSSLPRRLSPFFNPFKPGEEIGFAVWRVCQINGAPLPPLFMVPAGRQRTFPARTSRSIKRLISGQSRVHRLHALDLPFCPFLSSPFSLSLSLSLSLYVPFAKRAYPFFFFFTQFLPFYLPP